MAIVDIQKMIASEDLLVAGNNGYQLSWAPRRLSSFDIDGQTYLLAGGILREGWG
jgi:hypothetical protein